MTHVTCRLTAKNRDQLRNATLGTRVWAIPFTHAYCTIERCSSVDTRTFPGVFVVVCYLLTHSACACDLMLHNSQTTSANYHIRPSTTPYCASTVKLIIESVNLVRFMTNVAPFADYERSESDLLC